MFGRGFNFSLKADVVTLAVCVAVSVTLMALPEGTRIVVADRLGVVLTSPYWKTRNFGEDVLATAKENALLKARVLQLEMMDATDERLQRDVDRLAGPAVEPGYEGELVPCQVVMRQSGRFATMIKIRSLSPVAWEPWLPVVASDGYLGRVKSVINEREAWVELMAAADFALGVELERTGLLGILRPRADRFVVEMVGRDEPVEVGDIFITSGIAEVRDLPESGPVRQLTPRGFPVARVSAVDSPSDQIFKDITVEPLTSFSYNVTVFVVMPLDGEAPR